MSCRNKVLTIIFIALIVLCPIYSAWSRDADWSFSKYMATRAWVVKHIGKPDILLLDIRAREEYLEGHIPNAINLPLSQPGMLRDAYRNIFKDKKGEIATAKYAQILSDIGLSQEKTTIIYGHRGNYRTGIAFWILKLLGYKKASIFNAGIEGWVEGGGSLEKGARVPTSVQFTVYLTPELYASSPDVAQLARAYINTKSYPEGVIILDVRTELEYTGKKLKASASRGGHIPGAKLLPMFLFWEGNNDPNEKKPQELKSPPEIRTLIKEWTGYTLDQLKEANKIILYCHTGTRSSYAFWVLSLLGLDNLANYDDSWLVYSKNTDYPVEVEKPTRAALISDKRLIELEKRVSQLEQLIKRREISGISVLALIISLIALVVAIIVWKAK